MFSSFPFSLSELNHSARDTFFRGKVKVVDLGSLIKNPMYIGKVHQAVGGRVGFLINQEFDHQSILLPTKFAMRINA